MVVDNTEESYRSSIIEKQSNTSSKTSKSDKLSQGSGRKGEAGLSFEFIKEQFIVKEKTPWEQDLDLQTERILNILDKAIGKLRMVVSIIIQKLLRNVYLPIFPYSKGNPEISSVKFC